MDTLTSVQGFLGYRYVLWSAGQVFVELYLRSKSIIGHCEGATEA
jgi:hypothetical protein